MSHDQEIDVQVPSPSDSRGAVVASNVPDQIAIGRALD